MTDRILTRAPKGAKCWTCEEEATRKLSTNNIGVAFSCDVCATALNGPLPEKPRKEFEAVNQVGDTLVFRHATNHSGFEWRMIP